MRLVRRSLVHLDIGVSPRRAAARCSGDAPAAPRDGVWTSAPGWGSVGSMQALRVAFILVPVVLWAHAARGADSPIVSGEKVVARERVTQTIRLRDVSADEDMVSGVVTNTSDRRVRDVELLIRYEWLWNNEFRPGDDNPGRVVRVKVPEEIPPNGSVRFTYRPETRLPHRSDGRFSISVDPVGFVQFDDGAGRPSQGSVPPAPGSLTTEPLP